MIGKQRKVNWWMEGEGERDLTGSLIGVEMGHLRKHVTAFLLMMISEGTGDEVEASGA
jgi:hypothetical protein